MMRWEIIIFLISKCSTLVEYQAHLLSEADTWYYSKTVNKRIKNPISNFIDTGQWRIKRNKWAPMRVHYNMTYLEVVHTMGQIMITFTYPSTTTSFLCVVHIMYIKKATKTWRNLPISLKDTSFLPSFSL